MKKLGSSLTAATALIAFCTMADRVHAQMGPYSPPISPYLNLLRTGANPGLNFYNLVLPEFQLYGAANQLNMGQNNLGQAINSGGSSLGMTTGHPVMFGPNYLWYYPRRGGMGGMGGMGMGGMGMGGMGMGGMGMGGMGMGGMGMGGMGMGGMGMGGMGMGGMGMGGMGMGGMGMGGMGMYR